MRQYAAYDDDMIYTIASIISAALSLAIDLGVDNPRAASERTYTRLSGQRN